MKRIISGIGNKLTSKASDVCRGNKHLKVSVLHYGTNIHALSGSVSLYLLAGL
jgi:hypothetical protein